MPSSQASATRRRPFPSRGPNRGPSRGLSRRNTFLAAAAIVLGYLALVLATHEAGLGQNADGSARFRNLFEDSYDRSAYQQRGRWIATGGRPYVDEMAEYPQLSVLCMALPYLTFDHGIPRGEPFESAERLALYLQAGGLPGPRVEQLVDRNGPIWKSAQNPAQAGPDPAIAGELARAHPQWNEAELEGHVQALWQAVRNRLSELERNREAYGGRHQILMALAYLTLLALVLSNLAHLGHPAAYALLLCLPASLFFGLNRYDMLVTALVAGALWFQLRERPLGAGFMLGFAIMAKWFPIVLVPIFLSQNLHRSLGRARARGAPWRPLPELARNVLLPGLATALVCAGFLAWSYFYRGDRPEPGGWEAVKYLPDWHSKVREPNHASLLWKLTNPRDWAWFELADRPRMEQVFKWLQLAPGFVIALFPIRSNRSLLLGALVATLSMMIFSEFFSPQWVIWVTALSALVAPELRRFLVLAVALELVMYLQLPVLYFEALGKAPHVQYYTSPVFEAFHRVTNARVVLLFVFLATAIASLAGSLRARRPAAA